MKHLIWNLIWLVAFSLLSYFIITKFNSANSRCVDSVTRIEERLEQWEAVLN